MFTLFFFILSVNLRTKQTLPTTRANFPTPYFSTMFKTNKTKIIATLGPSSHREEDILSLIEAGVDVARINLSHGDRASHSHFIATVKHSRDISGKGTAILLDTRGPEIRVGELGAGIMLEEGDTVTFGNKGTTGKEIPTNYDKLSQDVGPGDFILLDDGKMRLLVLGTRDGDVTARTIVGGLLQSRKRVSLPDVDVNLPSITDQDEADIIFGVQQGVDFIAASFVRRADDVWEVRKVIEKAGGNQAIIAKIENRQGVENLQDILEAADGLMVARGDLGVEMPAEEVPVIQKKIIKEANKVGKPVITATQMLESMILTPTPTRAEASDVTNAIFDGTDAVMLSGETAVGKYPLEAVRFLARNARISEAALDYEAILAEGLRHRRPIITDAISYASCATAADLSADAIITATTSGSTALRVARYRPKTPIIAISSSHASLRKLQLVRGVIPLEGVLAENMDEQLNNVIRTAVQAELLTNGDVVVITAGLPLQTSGTTNMLKVHTVADICFTGQGIGKKKVSGTIRIINSEQDWENLPAKPIIVITKSDQSMLSYISQAVGIIAEAPGLTSHAAMVGRELSIPVICDVTQATIHLRNGQVVTLDPKLGQIYYGTHE
jgi:pyruvate kinase